jgi:hypothetical protein
MKRVKIVALAKDRFDENEISRNMPIHWSKDFIEIESIEAKPIPLDSDFFREHSWDSLMQAARDFVNGIWSAIKAFSKLTLWSLVMIGEAVRMIWKAIFK